MKQTELATVVSVLLGEKAIACEDYGPNEVLVKMKDINQEIIRKEVRTYLKEELEMQGYEHVEFKFDEDENLLVYATYIRNDFEEPTRLTTTVLALLEENVVEIVETGLFTITVKLANCNKKYEGKDMYNYLLKELMMRSFKDIMFDTVGHLLTVVAVDVKYRDTKRSKLATVMLILLRGLVSESKEFGQGLIALNVTDINIKIQDKDLIVYLKDELILQGFKDIQITIHKHGHLINYWLIVEAQEPEDDDVELSKLATTVLTVLGSDVYEYSMYYPDSISINFVDCNKKIGGKDLETYLEDILELQGFENIYFCGENGDWDTIFATEPQNDYYEQVDLTTVLPALLGDDLLRYDVIAPGFLKIQLVDCQKKYAGKDVHAYLEEVLKLFGYKELHFNYSELDWLTIIAKQPQTI